MRDKQHTGVIQIIHGSGASYMFEVQLRELHTDHFMASYPADCNIQARWVSPGYGYGRRIYYDFLIFFLGSSHQETLQQEGIH